MKNIILKIKDYLQKKAVQRRLRQAISILASIVVFATTYALVLPGLTLESKAICGMEEHEHTKDCYTDELICGQEESDGHQHSEACYNEEGELICGQEESEGHHHDSSCYESVLTCGKEAHIHTKDCYAKEEPKEKKVEEPVEEPAEQHVEEPQPEPEPEPEPVQEAPANESAQEDNSNDTSSDSSGSSEAAAVENGSKEASADSSAKKAKDAEELPEAEVAAPEKLGSINFRKFLSDNTTVYYHPKGSGKYVWEPVDPDVRSREGYSPREIYLEPDDEVLLHIAYELPAGTINETNAETEYSLPLLLEMSSDEVKDNNKYIYQIWNGTDRESNNLTAAGRYEIKEKRNGKGDLQDRWLVLHWNEDTAKHCGGEKLTDGTVTAEPSKVKGFLELRLSAQKLMTLDEKHEGEYDFELYWGKENNKNNDLSTSILFDADAVKEAEGGNAGAADGTAGAEGTGETAGGSVVAAGEGADAGTGGKKVVISDELDVTGGEKTDADAADATGEAAGATDATGETADGTAVAGETADGAAVGENADGAGAGDETANAEDAGKDDAAVGENADGTGAGDETANAEEAGKDGAAISEAADGTAAGDEAATKDAEAEAADANKDKETGETANSKTTLEYDGGAYHVTATFDQTAALPEGTVLSATEIGGVAAAEYIRKSEDALEGREIIGSHFYDIHFADANGEILLPAEGSRIEISIRYTNPETISDGTAMGGVFIGQNGAQGQDGATEQDGATGQSGAREIDIRTLGTYDNSIDMVTFSAEESGVYGVLNTKEVSLFNKGTRYAYQMEVGQEVSIAEIFDALRVTDEENGTILTAADVLEVMSSNEGVIGITHKTKFLGLFGEEDWVVSCRQSLDTEEMLTVTLRDERVLKIAVTEVDQLVTSVITADGETYKVSVTFDAESGIPEDATLDVKEITEESEEYAAYVDEVQASLEDGKKVQTAKLFDIMILDSEGNKVEPAAPVRVNIEFVPMDVPEGTSVELYHFQEESEAPQVMENVELREDERNSVNGLEFETDGFSVYGVVYTTVLRTQIISAKGDTYEITVSYDEDAGIPDGAELKVREILPESEEFAENIETANKQFALKEEVEISNPVQFDIAIVSNGVEVEPKEGSVVEVEIKLVKTLFDTNESDEDKAADNSKDKESKEDEGCFIYNGEVITAEEGVVTSCRVAHITEAGKAELIEEVKSDVDDDKIILQFSTESFSDYLFDGNNGHQFNDLPSTIYVGDEIYMWNQADYWVTNIGSVVTETKHNNQGSSDNFKTVTAINPGLFRICRSSDWNNGNTGNNGQYPGKYITVLDKRTGTTPPATIDTIDNASIGLTLNLFDYDLDNYLDDYFNGSAHYDNTCIADFAGHGINSGNALKFWGSGIGNNYGSLNQYVEHGVTSIVNTTLNSSGYPVLSDSSGGSGNRDLSYLFTPSDGTDKKAYTNVNGLFKKQGDYYVYDSNENYAYYDTSQGSGGSFKVYNSTYKQKSGGEAGTIQNKAIGFFPFHKWDEDYDLYVNWNKNLNHHFGMTMSVPFSLPKDPKAVLDTDSNPIVFEFSGDDDLWVFIDGKLAMDIGGIHQPTSGTIDFKEHKVIVNNSEQLSVNAFNSRFPDLYDGKTHTLQVFYIERGGCDSNCKIMFNLTQYGDIHFDKVDKDNTSDKLAGAVFGIYKDSDCTVPLLEQLKDGTSRAYVAESNAQGHVQFSDIPLGTYYLKELHAPEGYPLDNTVHTVQVYHDQTNGTVRVTVTIDGQDVELGIKILNGKPAPINLGLKKEWQNTDGQSISAPEGATATFEIKRIRNYETYTETPIEGEGREVSHLVVGWFHNGETHIHEEFDLISGTQTTVSWSYVNGYTGSKDCILNGTRIDKDYVTSNIVSEAFTMPAAGQTTTFYIVDESDNGEAIGNINVAGSQFYGNSGGGVIHTFKTITEPDTSFTYTGEHVTNNQITLPISSNTWEYIFADLPTFDRGSVSGVDHEVSFNYSYYLEEVSSSSPEGTTVVYKDLKGNVINSPTDAETTESGTLSITNKVPTGYLRIDKAVTYNGVAPTTTEQKSALAGTYTFKVFTDENCSKPYKVIQGEAPNQQEVDLTLTVTIANDGSAKSSDVVKIPIGNYWIEEQTPSQTGVTPEENRIAVTISANHTSTEPAIASFTNNKEESDNPDELAIELEKTFTGLPNAAKIPSGYQAALTYKLGSNTVTVPLTGATQGNVTCTKSEDGMTWHWRITQIPKDATDFGVYESNYDITGYTRITKINGNVVEDPGTPQRVTVLRPEITMTNITKDYTTEDNNKVFEVVDNQILLVRMTSQATVIVSPKSLSLATRQAIEKMLNDNGGKIPGDDGPQAQWVMNFVYFSHEIQGDSFSYGGRTIYFEGDKVKIPHKSSSHEVRVDINYTSTTAENSFTIENNYTEIPTEVDVLKVEKGKETTTKLKDAVFELRKLNDVAPTEPGGTLDYVKDENQQVIVVTKTTGDDGRLTFDNLTYGVYEIREVTPPPGYIQAENVIFYLRVDGGHITYVQKGSTKPSEWTEAPNSETATVYYMEAKEAVENNPNTPEDETTAAVNATFRVSNTPGAALPSTGGPGTTLYIILGSLMTLGAVMLLWRRRTI